KPLNPLARIHLGREDVALAVDRDVVEGGELADLATGSAEAAERLLRGVIDDTHLAVHAVDHVDEPLLLIGREPEAIDRAGAAGGLLIDVLGDEGPVFAENLQPVVGAIADID